MSIEVILFLFIIILIVFWIQRPGIQQKKVLIKTIVYNPENSC